MRFYARFACGNPHFHTSCYKISYDTRAKKTSSWQVWLHHSPSARAANSHSSENVSSHSYRNVLLFYKLLNVVRERSYMSCVTFFFTASTDSDQVPFSPDLIFENTIKSHGARSGEYGGLAVTWPKNFAQHGLCREFHLRPYSVRQQISRVSRSKCIQFEK